MIIHRKCGMCQGGCHVKVTVEDGKIRRVEADQDSPQGRVCARGALTPELLYSADRISHPLIRIGEKGEGKFRKATWDEALDYAAELLDKTRKTYGARRNSWGADCPHLFRKIRAMFYEATWFSE